MSSVYRVVVAQFEGATTFRAAPLAAGLLVATVRKTPDLADVELSIATRRQPPDLAAAALAGADVLGLSLYTWNANYTTEVARRARALAPGLRIVAGGPSVPRDPALGVAFLDAHPWIDVLVLGEGERAFVELVRAFRGGGALDAIPGIVYRAAADLVRTAPRPRMEGADFQHVGSPYLDGTFARALDSGELPTPSAAVFETNRGCPFACTFCDWGQAIQSRVHELPLDVVLAELRWAALRRIPYFYIVDANFGIRSRDAELARAIGQLAVETGFPRFVYFHLTKNATTRNLRTVEILREHGVGTQVALSMQDFDADVLLAIKRDNIRPADALALRERCHAQGIPTTNELLLGLPAQTAAGVRRGLLHALTPFPNDSFFLYPTRILVNAELAEPAYRARYGIDTRVVPALPVDPAEDPHVTEDEEIIVSSAAMGVEAWRGAFAFGFLLSALWNQRLLQTTIHWLQWSIGADLIAWLDAVVAGPGPRLRAVAGELSRFSGALLDGVAGTLPVDGYGPRRREPADAVCARVLEDPAGFFAEVAEVSAQLLGAPDAAATVRDVIAWDELLAPAPRAKSQTRTLQHDWPAYHQAMGERPSLGAGPVTVRRSAPPPMEPAVHLDAFLSSGWAKQPRVLVERLQ